MTKRKTATERLRELLDERGVEYTTGISEVYGSTVNRTTFGATWFYERSNGENMLEMRNITPDKAFAAMLMDENREGRRDA